MTFNIQTLLRQKSLESKHDVDILYRAGMKNVIDNIEYYVITLLSKRLYSHYPRYAF